MYTYDIKRVNRVSRAKRDVHAFYIPCRSIPNTCLTLLLSGGTACLLRTTSLGGQILHISTTIIIIIIIIII